MTVTQSDVPLEILKPHPLIDIRLVSGQLSATAFDVFSRILAQTQKSLMGQSGAGRRAGDFFEAPVRDLLSDEQINKWPDQALEAIERSLSECRSTMVHWVDLAEESSDVNDPTTGEVVLFDLTPLIYRYQVTSRDGVLWARWLLPPEFVDALSANECVLEVPIRTAMVNR